MPGHPSPLQIEDLFKETLKRSNTISLYCIITSPAKPSLCYFLILTLSQHYILVEIPFLLSPALIFLPLVFLLLFIFLFAVVFPTGTSDVNQWVGLRQGHLVFSWIWEHFSSSKKAVLLIWYIAETSVSF